MLFRFHDLRHEDLIALLLAVGFEERVRGNHHILWKDVVAEVINLQPKGSKAKPYQVKQVLGIFAKYSPALAS